jgi:hypothetical protein
MVHQTKFPGTQILARLLYPLATGGKALYQGIFDRCAHLD